MVSSYMPMYRINLFSPQAYYYRYLKPFRDIEIISSFRPSKNLVFSAVFFLLHFNLNSIKIMNKLR